METEASVVLAVSIAMFAAAHWAVLRWVEAGYPVAFKLSRGLAALLLTVLGFAALLDGAGHWRHAFVYRHAADDWMRAGLLIVCGHLIADFLWMAVGKVRFDILPRRDLIIHHLLGIAAFGCALYLEVGYALALLAMTTELMPVTTGLGALGTRIGSATLTATAERLRLHILAWFRLPLWAALFALTVGALRDEQAGDLYGAFMVVAFGLVVLMTLDVYWIRQCRRRVAFY